MKLLRESEIFDLTILTEGEGASKSLFIEGCFAQSEKKNRNGRIYPKQVMESSMGAYLNDFVNQRRAIGELSHPENRPMPKPEFASHLITSLRFEGNDVIGKAKILNTPQGQVVKGLLEGGVQLGVSTRGLGSIEERSGTTYVKNDYLVTAVDVVGDPSGIDCWVNAVNESRDWVFIDGRFEEREIEEAKKVIQKASSKNLNEAMLNEFQKFMKSISS
jgi:hypothetical protein